MICVVAMSTSLTACGGSEARKSSFLARGDEYFAAKNYEKARVEYRNALQIDPKDARARYASGRIAEKLGNPKEAVGQYQATIDLDAKHVEARASLARLYLFGGVPDKAMELVEIGLKDAPDSASLLTVRAAVEANKGNVEVALKDAQRALQIAKSDEYAIALVASLYRRTGDNDQAIAVVTEGVKNLPDSIDLRSVLADLEMNSQHPERAEEQLKKIVELEPKELRHRYLLARFYAGTKNNDAAEAVLRDAIKITPESIEPKLALVEWIATSKGKDQAEQQLQEFIKSEADSDQLKISLAGYFERQDRLEDAERTYREVIAHASLGPDGLSARNRLAALLLKRNDAKQASVLIEEVLKESARDNDALIMRGNLALARGDTAGAITDLRSVLRDQPSSIPVMRALARAHIQNREMALAEEVLRNATQSNPKDADARLDLAQLAAQNGKMDQARPLLDQLAKEYPNNANILENLYRVQAAQKDYASARLTAELINALMPDKAIGYYLMGMIDEALQKPDVAGTNYERALKAQPNSAEPLVALVRMDVAAKQAKKAFDRLDAVIAKSPEHVVARNLRAELLLSQQQIPQALEAYKQIITISPKWVIPHRGLARTYVAAKRTDDAVVALRDGIEKTNRDQTIVTDLASLYEATGRVDDAIKVYEDWLKQDASSIVAANNLAMLLADHRQDAASAEQARKLAERLASYDDAAVLDTRGWVKYKSGEYAQAVQLLARAVDKAEGTPSLHYHLGMAHLKNGDQEAARKSLQAAVESGRAFVGVQDAREALDRLRQGG
jgi:tetratricopeptide (TPR) repeat protein